jgi:geranylgeranyl transferase type-2 subunit alpha
VHGRKRVSKTDEPSPKELAKKAAKLAAYKKLAGVVISKMSKSDVSIKMLALTEKMAIANPDFYSVWGYRREIMRKAFTDIGCGKAPAGLSRESLLQSELVLTEKALSARNPKCYYVWQHRKWLLSIGAIEDYEKELGLTETFLKHDERNFHCWNYRRCVMSVGRPDLKLEREFTDKLIARNFSNYSAWHERSKIWEGDLEMVLHELNFVDEAIFTEPDDQSAWIYHRWLVETAMKCLGSAGSKTASNSSTSGPDLDLQYYKCYLSRLKSNAYGAFPLEATGTSVPPPRATKEVGSGVVENPSTVIFESISKEIKKFKGLLEVEQDLVWPNIQIDFLLGKQIEILSSMPGNECGGVTLEELKQERYMVISKLTQVDPLHCNYYQHLLDGGAKDEDKQDEFSYH